MAVFYCMPTINFALALFGTIFIAGTKTGKATGNILPK